MLKFVPHIVSIIMCLFPNLYWTQCGQILPLTDWTPHGAPDANWVVNPSGTSVVQTQNSNSSYFLSSDTLFNVRVSGTFSSANGDDDWLGFVMGHRGTIPAHRMYLFDWKRGPQGTAPGGFSYFDLINSNGPNGQHVDNPPNQNLLDSDFFPPAGNGYPWIVNNDHDFVMLYETTKTTIIIDGDTIFKTTGCYNPGKFGFYNSSQAQCTYSNFSYTVLADFFVEDTTCDSANFYIFCDETLTNYYDSINWDFGDGTQLSGANNINVNHVYQNPGTYNVTLTVRHKKSGCIATRTKEVFVRPKFNISIGQDTGICLMDSLLLEVDYDPSYTVLNYNWCCTPNDTSTLMVKNAGGYYVEAVNQHGCYGRDTISIIKPSPITTSITTQPLNCYNDSSGSAKFIPANGFGSPYQYQLNGGTFSLTDSITNLHAGSYAVTIIDSLGCSMDTNFSITEPNPIDIQVLSEKPVRCSNLCDGQVIFQASGGNPKYNFTTSTGNQINDSTFNGVCAGTHLGYVSDMNGCEDSVSFTINAPQPVHISSNLDSICISTPTSLTASASGGSLFPGSDYNYYWNNVGPSGNTLPFYMPPNDTVMRVFALDDSTCSSDTISIYVNLTPSISFTVDEPNGCAPHVVQVSPVLLNNTTLNSCLWSYGNGEATSSNCFPDPYTYTTPGVFEITYIAETDKGCKDTTIYSPIEVYEKPLADFTINPSSATATVFNPTFNFTNYSIDATDYIWLINGDTLRTEDAEYFFGQFETKIYPICLYAISQYNCYDTLCKEVEITNQDFLYIPNTFSPNNDGINDVFEFFVNGIRFENFSFKIYDKWGHELYSTDNPANIKWDGTYKGELSKTDTYIWILTGNIYVNGESNFTKQTGHINLIK